MPSRLRTLGVVIASGLQKLSTNPTNLEDTNPHPLSDGGNLFGIKEGEDIELTSFQVVDIDSLHNDESNQILPSETIPSNITEENNIIQGTATKVEELSKSEDPLMDESTVSVEEVSSEVKSDKKDELLIQEDISDISKNGENVVINDEALAKLNSIAAQEDAELEAQLGDLGPVSGNPEAPITADMRRKRTEQKLAKQRADNQIKDLEAKIAELEQDVSMMTEELTSTERANTELSSRVNVLTKQLKSAQEGVSSETDAAFELLASAGIPSELPDGTPMSISDAVMYLLDQHSITSSTINTLRNDLRKMAYKWRREGRNSDATYMFDVLATSSKQGSFIAVSSDQE